MRGIGKSFPGVRALDGVSLTLSAGEVLALVGENGAGKSTLMKILAGATPADSGTILVDGVLVRIDGPRAAEALGIGMIYQEFNLVPELGVVENIVLGNEPTRSGLLDAAAATDRARRVLEELGIDLALHTPVGRLAIAGQQMVEIAKAFTRKARIIVMDEPSAALSEREIERLFALIERLRAGGVGIIYISHRMEEIARIADRVTVLRDGRVIETRAVTAFPQDEIVQA
ncbi:MAG: ATP-binding cassette domain-containing protein, partial [Bacillati bacterium]